jgi:hypothetical protein
MATFTPQFKWTHRLSSGEAATLREKFKMQERALGSVSTVTNSQIGWSVIIRVGFALTPVRIESFY